LILSQAASNSFKINDKFGDKTFVVRYKDFIMNATETIEPNPQGETYLKLVESGEGVRHEHYLKEGEVQSLHGILFAFNKETRRSNQHHSKRRFLFYQSAFGGDFMRMADQKKV
jgi:hypothetical protein